MNRSTPLYSDKLVTMNDDSIIFKNYYFPFGTAKQVAFAEIDRISTPPLSPLMGKWRIWGSSDFLAWFPLDWKRPSRDKIFVVKLRNRSQRIGFTVENFGRAEKILREKRLLV